MIFNEEYLLPDTNHYNVICSKSQIVLCNSLTSDMSHVNRWKNRVEGFNKRTTPFSIGIDGTIYKHYEPHYYSDVVGIEKIDKHLIGITLVNEGYLTLEGDKNLMVNWIGDIYKRRGKIFNKVWRDKEYWAPYNRKQLNSLYKLCIYLSNEFDIELEFIGHNTVLALPENYNGILCRSNFSKYYYDVSPSFDFKYFDNKIYKTKNK